MKSVTAKVDSRWTSKEQSSFQTAHMMKQKLEEKDADNTANRVRDDGT